MNKNDKRSTADEVSTDRRSILKLFGVGTIGTAALAISGESAPAQTVAPANTGGYRETEHIKTYYDCAGF